MNVAVVKRFAGASGFRAGALGLSTNEVRPVRFDARIREHVHPLRLALQTLGELVWSDATWLGEDEYARLLERTLDPVITVHPDRVFFEAFSQDQSAYGLVIADASLFEPSGTVRYGTTNVDFTQALHASLGQMRSSRDCWFRVGPTGFGVEIPEAEAAHFEEKVELPESWVRGFLQLQGAMALPGTRFSVRPVDMKTLIRVVSENVAYTSPRSIRWEFEPGHDVRAVAEPWEEVIEMKGSGHSYAESKQTRVWGRRRLSLIEPLLGYAGSVDVYLKGRALPSFYAVELPGVVFVLGLSGWSSNTFAEAASFDLLTSDEIEAAWLDRAMAHLATVYHCDEEALSAALGCDVPTATRALSQLCRQGRVIYDVRARDYRHRELFATPIDAARFYPEDPRKRLARELVESGQVRIESDATREKERVAQRADGTSKVTAFTDRVLEGAVGDALTHVVRQDTGRIIFGRCTCPFFDENLMNKGPCEHMLALSQTADLV